MKSSDEPASAAKSLAAALFGRIRIALPPFRDFTMIDGVFDVEEAVSDDVLSEDRGEFVLSAYFRGRFVFRGKFRRYFLWVW